MMGNVILVDKKNHFLGEMEKMEAHRRGLLHRAFSIFIFNNSEELLLQKRNSSKYHSGGLWTNTVCSHPSPGESYKIAVHRRLKEEMGFDCAVKKVGCFIYKSKFSNELTEHEYDCVFVGQYEGQIYPNPDEIEDYKWLDPEKIRQDLTKSPDKYTFWFKKIMTDKKFFDLAPKFSKSFKR